MITVIIDREKEIPLYVQIRDSILEQIQTGKLKAGDRLPTVVALAQQLEVTKATVVRAFEDLSAAGNIVSHVGRGTFIADKPVNSNNIHSSRMQLSPWMPCDPEFALAARRLRMGAFQSLQALQSLAQKPGLLQLTSGVPDAKLTRDGILAELTNQALEVDDLILQQYSPPGGLPQLREAIAERLSDDQLTISPQQVLITSGSQQAVSLLAQAALEQRRRVICEVPCYLGIPKAFGALGHWVETITRDQHGPMLERLQELSSSQPSLLYMCPLLHNPMGTDLSEQRRRGIIDWAQKHDSWIVADEIFRGLHFSNKTVPSLLRDAGEEKTIVIGSLSKTFMCGLRIGWLITSKERVQSLLALKHAMDIGCPPLMQAIAWKFLQSGEYDKHLQCVRQHYQKRCDKVLKALQKYMPKQVSWTKPAGGFHLWAQLPKGYSSLALYLMAIERGVVIRPGPYFDIDHRFVNAFHIGYSNIAESKITEAIALLADAVKQLLQQNPSDLGLSGLGDFL